MFLSNHRTVVNISSILPLMKGAPRRLEQKWNFVLETKYVLHSDNLANHQTKSK